MNGESGRRSIWIASLLEILKKRYPREAQLKDIYIEMENYISPENSDRQHKHEVRAYLNRLKNEDKVENPRRGYWRYRA